MYADKTNIHRIYYFLKLDWCSGSKSRRNIFSHHLQTICVLERELMRCICSKKSKIFVVTGLPSVKFLSMCCSMIYEAYNVIVV